MKPSKFLYNAIKYIALAFILIFAISLNSTANAYDILGNASHSTSPSGDLTAGFEFTPDKNITVTGFRRYFGTKISLWKADGTKVLESS